MERRQRVFWGLVAMAAAGACAAPPQQWWEPVAGHSCQWLPVEGEDFYAGVPDGPVEGNMPGQPLRLQPGPRFTPAQLAAFAHLPVRDVHHGFQLFRLLYLSQAPLGVARWVSAQLVIPDVMAAEPMLVVRGHGTSGMADSAAPSHDLGPGLQSPVNPFSFRLVAQGHPVIQSDYAGLGTHGPHPYMILDAAAFSVLDSARAAQRLCIRNLGIADLPQRVVLEGHSQGGHAVLGAVQYQPSYAPGLNIAATVAFAPAGEPAMVANQIANEARTRLVTPVAMTMLAYEQYYGTFDLQDYLNPSRKGFPAQAEKLSAPLLAAYTSDRPAWMFSGEFLDAIRAGDVTVPLLAPLHAIQMANTPGNITASMPILMLHGSDDDLISHDATQTLHDRLCSHGSRVRWVEVAGASHSGVVDDGTAYAMAWLQEQWPVPRDGGDCP